jgi:hypothetical protein
VEWWGYYLTDSTPASELFPQSSNIPTFQNSIFLGGIAKWQGSGLQNRYSSVRIRLPPPVNSRGELARLTLSIFSGVVLVHLQ